MWRGPASYSNIWRGDSLRPIAQNIYVIAGLLYQVLSQWIETRNKAMSMSFSLRLSCNESFVYPLHCFWHDMPLRLRGDNIFFSKEGRLFYTIDSWYRLHMITVVWFWNVSIVTLATLHSCTRQRDCRDLRRSPGRQCRTGQTTPALSLCPLSTVHPLLWSLSWTQLSTLLLLPSPASPAPSCGLRINKSPPCSAATVAPLQHPPVWEEWEDYIRPRQ